MGRQVILVGNPNVGKSVIFNQLTGRYVNVSNYPGTTVEIAVGQSRLCGREYDIIDTPGVYSLSPLTDEEQVTRRLLLRRRADTVVHVIDAKNIRRMLNLTLQLIDAELPVILNINLMDEAKSAGLSFNFSLLAKVIGIPVVATTAVEKAGIDNLKKTIADYRCKPVVAPRFSAPIEQAVAAISARIKKEYVFSKRMLALLLLQDDRETHAWASDEAEYLEILKIIRDLGARYQQPISLVIAIERQKMVDDLLSNVVRFGMPRHRKLRNIFDRLTREPVTGIPILVLVIYFGLYKVVGGIGAGVMVDYINNQIFGSVLTPLMGYAADRYLPWEWMKSLLVGSYGLFTFGLRYAVAIILPVVGTFFIVFAVLEDSGYLPRLAMLVDGLFKKIGLNGRAVIPVVLGLGCGTMAVFVTRTLETKRERLLATFLLSLAIPCSAQFGVVLAILSFSNVVVGLWAAYVLLVFISAGWLGAKLLPGQRSPFYMELPPLRLPNIQNVLTKVYTRMVWYFTEIIPVFIVVSVVLWLGDQTGVLAYIIEVAEPIMVSLGLPPQTAQTFLLGFFRRDYGAAGLYDMTGNGMLDEQQLLVAAVTMTLFVPCVAQLIVIIKEQGISVAAMMMVLISMIAWMSGWLMMRFAGLLFF
ncbi:MAG: feoB 3 [Firmicutes bacterium]|nr:feoB 3 [Bacillota bacterium]